MEHDLCGRTDVETYQAVGHSKCPRQELAGDSQHCAEGRQVRRFHRAVWALIERTRWSNVVLGIAGFAIAVMVFRMYQIWVLQIA